MLFGYLKVEIQISAPIHFPERSFHFFPLPRVRCVPPCSQTPPIRLEPPAASHGPATNRARRPTCAWLLDSSPARVGSEDCSNSCRDHVAAALKSVLAQLDKPSLCLPGQRAKALTRARRSGDQTPGCAPIQSSTLWAKRQGWSASPRSSLTHVQAAASCTASEKSIQENSARLLNACP